MFYHHNPDVPLIKGMRMIILLSEAYPKAFRHFGLAGGVNTYNVWEQGTSGVIKKNLLVPYTGEGPPIKVVATLKGWWFDNRDYLYQPETPTKLLYVDGFQMQFEWHQAYPLHMHRHCLDKMFVCKQCGLGEVVGNVDGRYLFSVGWICGPCRDYLEENETISRESLDENIEGY